MDEEPLQDKKIYDIAIIGGGIVGAGIARDAVLRGFKVILFEKNTFGSGTSSKSSKLIHGGIRYLEIAWHDFKRGRFSQGLKNLSFVFSSLRESYILQKIAPKIVKPISFLVPITKNGSRGRLSIFFGAWVYSLLALFAGGTKMPRLLWSKKSISKMLPQLNTDDLVGAVIIWDHWAWDLLLVQKTMQSAIRHGLQAKEGAMVENYRLDPKKNEYEIKVSMNQGTENFYAKKLINASGPWVDKVRAAVKEKGEHLITPIAGSHITFKKFLPLSVILEAEDGRIFFVVNMDDQARVGTTERKYADPDTLETTEEEVDYLLAALKKYFPKIALTKDMILSKDSGIRPLAHSKNDHNPSTISREHQIKVGPSGVIHVLGVKLTDHRRAAEKIIDWLVPEFLRSNSNIKRKTLTDTLTLDE